jgi:hypothetical protein
MSTINESGCQLGGFFEAAVGAVWRSPRLLDGVARLGFGVTTFA